MKKIIVCLLLLVFAILAHTSLAQNDMAGYWMNKGIALDNLGNYQEAVKAYQNATQAYVFRCSRSGR